METRMRNDPARLKADNAEYLWHPMAHPKAMKSSRPDIIVRGQGSWIWDVDGHQAESTAWAACGAANLGLRPHARSRDAIVAQFDELALLQHLPRHHASAAAIELSSGSWQMMQPGRRARRSMFSNGGSDAV
jgi:adenosylmethionine-8-amino-7-oxononanoate aminotransferase